MKIKYLCCITIGVNIFWLIPCYPGLLFENLPELFVLVAHLVRQSVEALNYFYIDKKGAT